LRRRSSANRLRFMLGRNPPCRRQSGRGAVSEIALPRASGRFGRLHNHA
jgi:hypothetical protein